MHSVFIWAKRNKMLLCLAIKKLEKAQLHKICHKRVYYWQVFLWIYYGYITIKLNILIIGISNTYLKKADFEII